MENIFYGPLALNIVGKPISKENIRAVLEVMGTRVNEPMLDTMDAFVDSLEAAGQERPRERKTRRP